jgi:hypothetical protein
MVRFPSNLPGVTVEPKMPLQKILSGSQYVVSAFQFGSVSYQNHISHGILGGFSRKHTRTTMQVFYSNHVQSQIVKSLFTLNKKRRICR